MSWQPNPLEEQRLDKLARLREIGIDPYPLRVERTHTTHEAIAAFEATTEGEPVKVIVCGRLLSVRDMGKTIFAHIGDESGRLQLFLRRDDIGDESHTTFKKLIDLGDFIQAGGEMFRTKLGEVSLHVRDWRLLSKAISPLPVAKEQEVDGKIVRYSAFTDVEERYRQRYADLAANPEVRDIFRKRAHLVSALRRFMDDHDFLEVETPILQPLYGGAAAKPFTTYHNQLKQELFLRISFELYLKRLLVGGYERVYEIGRDFRNEGVSFKHNPEFTQLEFYAAYWDFHDVMDFTERMVAYAAEAVLGTTDVVFNGKMLQLGQPWLRITMRDAIKHFAEIDYMDYPDQASLAAAVRKIGGEAPPGAPWGKLIDGLLGDFVEPHLIQPTIIMNYPRDISPLAKAVPGDPLHVERFEFFIGGMEMGNAFTELNDPIDQRERFESLQEMFGKDDEERNPIDEDYLRAMRYGMPPNGGFGMGIDRLAMLLTDSRTLREVLLFPHLREREE
ncbi:MAG: lysine--tRNA ligase [Anaerolineae bacterium]|nr:MAG: lysine--tRNA ligase [Anaerolineae bacterium]